MTEIEKDTTKAVQALKEESGVAKEKHIAKGPFSEDSLNLIRIIICLALLVPIVQLYFTIPAAINMWVANQYIPFVNMIYFIVIIIGGILLIRYTFIFSEKNR